MLELFATLFGFAFAGLLASGFEFVAERPAGLDLLHLRSRQAALASVPLIVFAAPYLIVRAVVCGPRAQTQAAYAFIATVSAGLWSLMSGTAIIAALQRLGDALS